MDGRRADYGPREDEPAMRSNPIYSVEAERAAEGREYDESDFDGLPTVQLDVGTLVSPQPGVYDLEGGEQPDPMPPLHVVRLAGMNVVWDGNHRASYARREGMSSVPAKVLDGQDGLDVAARDSCGCGSCSARRPGIVEALRERDDRETEQDLLERNARALEERVRVSDDPGAFALGELEAREAAGRLPLGPERPPRRRKRRSTQVHVHIYD